METATLKLCSNPLIFDKDIDGKTAICYQCFQRLTDGQFCVQSVDYYHLPLQDAQVKALDGQFLELFIDAFKAA